MKVRKPGGEHYCENKNLFTTMAELILYEVTDSKDL